MQTESKIKEMYTTWINIVDCMEDMHDPVTNEFRIHAEIIISTLKWVLDK